MTPVIPDLPRARRSRGPGRRRRPQVVDEVFLEVRDRRRFEFLQVAEFVHFFRHPVGDDEEAAAARLAVGQQRLHLGEELFVGVDVFGVLDRDAGLLFEVGDGLFVDVERPVGDRQLAARACLRPSPGCRCRRPRLAPAAVRCRCRRPPARASPPAPASASAEPACKRRLPASFRLAHSSSAPPLVLLVLVDHHVHVLGLPAEHDAGAAAGQPLAFGLVGVGDEHGHPHSLADADDDLGRGAEVDRALDHALDRGRAVGGAGARRPGRSAASPAAPPRRSLRRRRARRCRRRPRGRCRASPVPAPETVAGIRLETPMKPATKLVVGRS